MARILIISPGSPCRNPRPVKEAETLGRAGHDVTLLTLFESAALREQERALTAGAPYRHEAVDGDAGRSAYFWRRLRRRLAVKATELGFESLHALGHAGTLRRRAREISADLTIVHNELPHWIGCDLLDQGRRVAADFEDWHSEDLLPADRRGRPLGKMRGNEQRLLRQAAYTSTTSGRPEQGAGNALRLPAPLVLTNSFPLQPAPQPVAAGEAPAFFWFSQTVGPGRGLEEFCAAWTQTTRPSRLVLLGQIRTGYDQRLLTLLPAAFHSRVTFLPLVPPAELPGVIARHDIGLALEQSFIVNRDLTITNKILQYLNAGLAVVASETAGQREVLANAPGAGILVNLDRPVELTGQLDALLSDRARLAVMGAAARRAAETTYCWEKEAPKLLARVEAVLAAR